MINVESRTRVLIYTRPPSLPQDLECKYITLKSDFPLCLIQTPISNQTQECHFQQKTQEFSCTVNELAPIKRVRNKERSKQIQTRMKKTKWRGWRWQGKTKEREKESKKFNLQLDMSSPCTRLCHLMTIGIEIWRIPESERQSTFTINTKKAATIVVLCVISHFAPLILQNTFPFSKAILEANMPESTNGENSSLCFKR